MSIVRTVRYVYWPREIQSDGTNVCWMEPVLNLRETATWLDGGGWSTAHGCGLEGETHRNAGAQPIVALDAEKTSL